MFLLRAWTTLVWLSFRRLLWSANTLMVMFPLAACGLYLLVRRGRMLTESVHEFDFVFERFSDRFVIGLFASFIIPICALAFATTSIGGDREDRTLLFLLVRPVPRWLILLGKASATLPIVLGLVVGSFYVCCRIAGPVGEKAYALYLPAVFYMALAYVGLFHLMAVTVRHSTVVALTYALFIEGLLGAMTGIVKRVAVNFYGRSMMFDLQAREGLGLPDPAWFVPVSARAGAAVLLTIAVGGLLAAMLVFSRREYRDLS